MRVEGWVGRKELHILENIGSTHNFLYLDTGNDLGCVVPPVTSMKVTVVNASVLNCEAQCINFSQKMKGQTYVTDVLLIELDTYDMVLGVQWL